MLVRAKSKDDEEEKRESVVLEQAPEIDDCMSQSNCSEDDVFASEYNNSDDEEVKNGLGRSFDDEGLMQRKE